MKRTAIATALTSIIGMGAAQAGTITLIPTIMTTNAANFTMLDEFGGGSVPAGTIKGGANDVSMLWDGTAYTSNSDYTGPGSVSNITMSSTSSFFSHNWTAHDVQVFAPGTYTFDTTLGGGVPESGTQSLTVGTGQLGMHLLWDWNGNLNNDVVILFAFNSVFGSGNGLLDNPGFVPLISDGLCQDKFGASITGANCLWDGPNFGSDAVMSVGLVDATQIWGFASIDQTGGDGIPGTPMTTGGPFADFNFNFNANLEPVPIPAAIWLFGSGLLGLIGVAKRKKA